MLKDSTAVIGLGLGGMTVTYEFQERNYLTYSVNGSEQDIKSIPNAKNSMRLEGYDGLAGNRELAYEALKRNKHILKKLKEIEKKINIVIASGGGSSGSGCITFVSEILVQNPDKIVVPVILMPRQDESIQKRLNAYNVAKELMQIEELGAIIFVNNESYSDLKKINTILVNMLDASSNHFIGFPLNLTFGCMMALFPIPVTFPLVEVTTNSFVTLLFFCLLFTFPLLRILLTLPF